MRDAFAGLTSRGRFLLLTGLFLAVAAVLLGQRDLLRAAVLLVALPLTAGLMVSRTRYRLTCSRLLDPPRVPAGAAATVRLRVENVSRLPSGVLLMEDALPYALGRRPRFVLDRIPAGVSREVDYPVRADVRGRYRVGPLSVRLTDPFGLSSVTRSFSAVDELVVTPAVSALPRIALGGEWATGGDTTSRMLASSGSDDATTREYRHGDDLRKVHWRSTARVGELMVRQEEHRLQSRCTLVLDGRARGHRGDGPGSSFEWAVSATASIAASLAQQGFGLRLLAETGRDLLPTALVTEGLVLDVLAGVTTSQTPSLAAVTQELHRSGPDGALIAVLGLLSATDSEELARLRQGAGRCIAVLIDTPTWAPRAGGRGEQEAAAHRLELAGWRVLRAAHGTTLASLWPQAGVKAVPA